MLLDNSTGHVDIIFTPNRVVLKGSDGAVAQLGERLNGIQEVVGSIPISSTKEYKNGLHYAARFFIIGRLMGFHVYVLKSDSDRSYIGHSMNQKTLQ